MRGKSKRLFRFTLQAVGIISEMQRRGRDAPVVLCTPNVLLSTSELRTSAFYLPLRLQSCTSVRSAFDIFYICICVWIFAGC
jgi:hypothetical protein